MSKRNALVLWAAGALLLAAGAPLLAADAPERGAEYVEEKPDAEPPPAPIGRDAPKPPDSAAGAVVLSNGGRVEGLVHLTRDAALEFYDPAKKKRLSVRLDELTHIEQKPVVERMEKEWRWKENANDEKVYTGREYPMRELETTLRFKDGRALTGPLAALVFVANANGEQRFLLHKRQKGEPGQTLADLVYVTLVDLRVPAKKAPAGEPDAPKKAPDAK
jgi:hypothetical protein